MTKIKICGLTRERDIEFVNELMPDYIGFVFAESRRRVTPVQAKALRTKLKERIVPVGVFADAHVDFVARLLQDGVIGMAQLHGTETAAYVAELRRLTGKPILQAFSIAGPADLRAALSSAADHILLDHGAGGTGGTFEWTLAAGFSRPFFLAGGLTPENVRQAASVLHPFAVDVSSGVETGGIKDYDKIRRFIAAVREGSSWYSF